MPKSRPKIFTIACAWTVAACVAAPPAGAAPKKPLATRTAPVVQASAVAIAVQANSTQVEQGVKWLIQHQLRDGGWGQGDESPNMGHELDALRDRSNVADTSMALLALARAGHTPGHGKYGEAANRGLGFVLRQIEASDADSLAVTSVQGTRVQAKIGTYVDTFASLLLLSELKGTLPNPEANARLERALTKVLAKVERNQAADGTWGNQGWAPVLTQSLASKGLNRAARKGAAVSERTLERAERKAQDDYLAGPASPTSGGAGVALYSEAANLGAMNDALATRKGKEAKWRSEAQAAAPSPAREAARGALAQTQVAQRTKDEAEQGLVGRLSDPDFVRGFGSNGGEEFLSYMLVSESLLTKGGEAWKRWSTAITKLIHDVQNGDGSWTGHHCITGRTFCTATALLVLMADRAAGPVASKLRMG